MASSIGPRMPGVERSTRTADGTSPSTPNSSRTAGGYSDFPETEIRRNIDTCVDAVTRAASR